MFKTVLFKESIKLKRILKIVALLYAMVLVYVFINLDYSFRGTDGVKIWYAIIYKSFRFYEPLIYIAMLSGLILGIAQMAPEIGGHRLKLYLHLPASETALMMNMLAVGTLILLTLFFSVALATVILTSFYFPREIVFSMLKNLSNGFIAGFLIYIWTFVIYLEQNTKMRVVLAILLAGVMQMFLQSNMYDAYDFFRVKLLIIAFASVFTMPYILFRYKGGIAN